MKRTEKNSITTAHGRTKRSPAGRFLKAAAPNVKLAVKVRRQTAREGREFTTALNLLVAELVRCELRRGGESK